MKTLINSLLLIFLFSCSKESYYQLFTCSECVAKAKIYSGNKFITEIMFDCQEPEGSTIQLNLLPANYEARFYYPDTCRFIFPVSGTATYHFNFTPKNEQNSLPY